MQYLYLVFRAGAFAWPAGKKSQSLPCMNHCLNLHQIVEMTRNHLHLNQTFGDGEMDIFEAEGLKGSNPSMFCSHRCPSALEEMLLEGIGF